MDVSVINGNNNTKYFISRYPADGIKYLDFLKKNQIDTVFNFCYMDNIDFILMNSNINYYLLPFKDGSFPEKNLVDKWINLSTEILKEKKKIAVFCKSGLGRAPTMVAIKLITENFKSKENIIIDIRNARNGCFNQLQIKNILEYQIKTQQNICCMIS